MGWKRIDEMRKLRKLVDYVMSREIELTVRFENKNSVFLAKAVELNELDEFSSGDQASHLILEKLNPEDGISIPESTQKLILEFEFQDNVCRFFVKYLGEENSYTTSGATVGFPQYAEVNEKRREDRSRCDMLDLVYVEFNLSTGSEKDLNYSFDVIDCSLHGLGILVPQEDTGLIKMINIGDEIHKMRFFAEQAMIEVNGTVRHITQIDEGKRKGAYIIGVSTPEIIESGRPVE